MAQCGGNATQQRITGGLFREQLLVGARRWRGVGWLKIASCHATPPRFKRGESQRLFEERAVRYKNMVVKNVEVTAHWGREAKSYHRLKAG
ncbi:hypothetical protein GCM10011496_19750 [Polaromonas eurypsychrophila]|uniref:Uncharacterized protein n=1 Tax=Polaromonas eurypsychrophila TaxID=1614635 RepID=A0A916WGI3_9BURK|nr:hypothetical protein GCM10011496_19750 [Polaromonas eurypsychrophila]